MSVLGRQFWSFKKPRVTQQWITFVPLKLSKSLHLQLKLSVELFNSRILRPHCNALLVIPSILFLQLNATLIGTHHITVSGFFNTAGVFCRNLSLKHSTGRKERWRSCSEGPFLRGPQGMAKRRKDYGGRYCRTWDVAILKHPRARFEFRRPSWEALVRRKLLGNFIKTFMLNFCAA